MLMLVMLGMMSVGLQLTSTKFLEHLCVKGLGRRYSIQSSATHARCDGVGGHDAFTMRSPSEPSEARRARRPTFVMRHFKGTMLSLRRHDGCDSLFNLRRD